MKPVHGLPMGPPIAGAPSNYINKKHVKNEMEIHGSRLLSKRLMITLGNTFLGLPLGPPGLHSLAYMELNQTTLTTGLLNAHHRWEPHAWLYPLCVPWPHWSSIKLH